MPGYPTISADPQIGQWWTSILNAITQLQDQVNNLTSGSTSGIITDGYGNAHVVSGQNLRQTVVIGAAHNQPGVQVSTVVGTPSNPLAGIAVQQSLTTTTITLTEGSTSATVGSSAGMSVGMPIGAADVSDPSTGIATPAISPGTTISAISGTAITLSQKAAESGTNIYCAACWFTPISNFIT